VSMFTIFSSGAFTLSTPEPREFLLHGGSFLLLSRGQDFSDLASQVVGRGPAELWMR
jgi:hypothetical protein